MTLPKIVSPKGQVIGNLAMGGAAAVLTVMIAGWFGADVSGEAGGALGTLFGGLFQKFNLFG